MFVALEPLVRFLRPESVVERPTLKGNPDNMGTHGYAGTTAAPMLSALHSRRRKWRAAHPAFDYGVSERLVLLHERRALAVLEWPNIFSRAR